MIAIMERFPQFLADLTEHRALLDGLILTLSSFQFPLLYANIWGGLKSTAIQADDIR
jgi:hypothetical protein